MRAWVKGSCGLGESPDPDLRGMQELTIGAGNQPLEIKDEWDSEKGSRWWWERTELI